MCVHVQCTSRNIPSKRQVAWEQNLLCTPSISRYRNKASHTASHKHVIYPFNFVYTRKKLGFWFQHYKGLFRLLIVMITRCMKRVDLAATLIMVYKRCIVVHKLRAIASLSLSLSSSNSVIVDAVRTQCYGICLTSYPRDDYTARRRWLAPAKS